MKFLLIALVCFASADFCKANRVEDSYDATDTRQDNLDDLVRPTSAILQLDPLYINGLNFSISIPEFKITLEDVRISGWAQLNSKGPAKVKSLEVNLDIKKSVVNLEGAPKFTNKLISRELPSILRRDNSRVINAILKQLKNGPINDILSGIPIEKLTEIIKKSQDTGID